MKTPELTGAQLDWAVAKCEGLSVFMIGGRVFDPMTNDDCGTEYQPSDNWAQGGPIIERENVHLFQQTELESTWTASMARGNKVGWRFIQYGPTPLIAAMRCYVASKLGDEVELPKGLK
jgi:hypothetical protein